MDLQGKPLQEWSEGQRHKKGWSLTHMAAENTEAYLSYKSPSEEHGPQNTSTRRRSPHNTWPWKSAGILSPREKPKSAWNLGAFLGSQCRKSCFQYSPWTPAEGAWLEMKQNPVRTGWVVQLRRESWKDRGWDPWTESLSHSAHTIFLGSSTTFHTASVWETAIAPASGLPVDAHCRAHTLWSQLPQPRYRGRRWYQRLSCVAPGQGGHYSLAHLATSGAELSVHTAKLWSVWAW